MSGSPETAKVAWVTGAGKGIGRALALRLANEGWMVAASARTREDLESLAASAPRGRIRPYMLDVADPDRSESVLRAVERELGPIELAILNAGTHRPVTASTFSLGLFRGLVETNLMGVVNGLDPLIPVLVGRGRGRIAVVASLAGYRGLPTSAAYGATKAALINMCEALKPDLERHGVQLNLINPGFVETPLTDRNDFSMPFLMPVEAAVDCIMRGLERDAFEIAFPWRFAILMKLLRLLPDRLFFTITRRMLPG